MRYVGFVACCWAVCLGTEGGAADFDRDKLAAIRQKMQAFVDVGELSGVVTVVGDANGIASLEAIGLRDREAKLPMEKDTLFRIASMTKPITALAIMMLVDEGKLSVDDPLEKHLPEFRQPMLIAQRSKDSLTLTRPKRLVTVRDLLTHTSGLPGTYPPGIAELYSRRHLSLKEATLVLSQRPLEFEPGSKWAYCNPGIDVLGRVVEVASGMAFEDFLKQRLFDPLGMKDTTFYPSPEQLKRSATIYVKKDQLTPIDGALIGPTANAKFPIPAGGLFSTAEDLARLYQMLLRKGQGPNGRILSEASLSAMTQVQTGELKTGFVDGMGFGFGFAVVRQPMGATEVLSPGTFGHGGAFGTQGWIDPHQGVYVILLIQRFGLPNADGSEMRKALQAAAYAAIRSK